MRRFLLILTVVMLALAIPGAVLAEPAVLTVRGTGIVSVDADIATIMLGVRELSDDVATAQSTVNRKINNVIEALQAAGVDIADISTLSISIYPEYDYNQPGNPIIGYSAENTISVATRDIDGLGKYIDAAFEAGANTFNSIGFSASDTIAENKRALALAVENARDKAESLASASGLKLGAIRSIAEEAYGYNDNGALYARSEASADGSTRVYASPLSVTASVTVEFELEPAE